MEEMVDEVNLEGKIIATHPKSRLKSKMFLHNASLVIPIAQGNKIVLSLRAKDKEPYPGTWCCAVGGKAISGETPLEAAMREMNEEIGRTYELKEVASFAYDSPEYKSLFTIFTTKKPISLKEFIFDTKEIQYSKEFTIEEVMRMIAKTPERFAPTFIAAIKEFEKHFEE
ncbi:Isopentenyl-diphosphate Delta-isomerase [uncultured archaeon]|nr:Isopentenyl-diphosphate Delta-isomerase [uncultured archaeon]